MADDGDPPSGLGKRGIGDEHVWLERVEHLHRLVSALRSSEDLYVGVTEELGDFLRLSVPSRLAVCAL